MVDVGDSAPDFTAPLAHGDGEITPFTLSEHLDEAPIVLAFFPGAFTAPCRSEMRSIQERLQEFYDAGATVYGVSVDAPFSLNEFREQNGLEFGLVSDTNKEIVDAYGVRIDFEDVGYYGLAQRSVFVIDADGEITYRWIADEPSNEPDYGEMLEAAGAATA